MKDNNTLLILAIVGAGAFFMLKGKKTSSGQATSGQANPVPTSGGTLPNDGWWGYANNVLNSVLNGKTAANGISQQPQASTYVLTTGQTTGAANRPTQAASWVPLAGSAIQALPNLINSVSNWFRPNDNPGASSAGGNSSASSFQTINLPSFSDPSNGYYYGVDGGSSGTSNPWGNGNDWDFTV